MSCQKHKTLLERWWNDQMSPAERAELEAQLAECADCRRELEGSREIWELMGHMPVPEPSGEMQTQFNAMLEGYKSSVEGKRRPVAGGWTSLRTLFVSRPSVAVAFSLALLLGGAALGWVAKRPRGDVKDAGAAVAGPAVVKAAASTAPVVAGIPSVKTEQLAQPQQMAQRDQLAQPAAMSTTGVTGVAAVTSGVADRKPIPESRQLQELTAQVHEMRKMVMLSLLQNPAASERIRAVSYTSEIRRTDPSITEALLATLNNDPNVNVRLTTLEALTHYAHDPAVREGLVRSILQQESPLMQAALADVMLKLQEKRAVPSFEKLLQHKDLNGMVRTKIEQTIVRLT